MKEAYLYLGLRRVSSQIRAEARQALVFKTNAIQRVSTDFRLVFPVE